MLSDYVIVRPGRTGDAEALSGIFRDSWALAYQGIIPYAYLRAMTSRRGEAYWRQALAGPDSPLVLEVGGVAAGYTTSGRSRSNLPPEGEIYELYIAPVYQGLGFGEQLFESTRARLDHKRYRGLLVWALTDNMPACEFYYRRGGRPAGEADEHFGEVRVGKTAFCWD